jgi:hypothetical protein
METHLSADDPREWWVSVFGAADRADVIRSFHVVP